MRPYLVHNEKSYQIHPLHANVLLSVSYWILCNVQPEKPSRELQFFTVTLSTLIPDLTEVAVPVLPVLFYSIL